MQLLHDAINLQSQISIGSADTEPNSNQINAGTSASRAEIREENDLIAQQKMADYALKTLILAVFALALNVAGAALLFFTLLFTKRAADAAIGAVHAERAWITCEGLTPHMANNVNVVGYPDFNDGIYNGIILKHKWSNTGRSPALNCDIYCEIQFIEPDQGIYNFLKKTENPKGGVVGQGMNFSGHHLFIPEFLARKIKDNSISCFVYSIVLYTDTYNIDFVRKTECCFQIEINGEYVQDGQVLRNVSSMPVGNQNSAT